MLTKAQIDTLRRTRTKGRNRLGHAMRLVNPRLTQVVLAERTGFTQSFISKVENGVYTDLPGETMRTFAAVFGCAIEDLFPARSESAVAS